MIPVGNFYRRKDMIYWASFSTEAFHDKAFPLCWTSEDVVYAEKRTRNPAIRDMHLLIRGTLRALLFHVTRRRDWCFAAEPGGRPCVRSGTGERGPHISLSHTKGMMACAVSETHPVGIDVQYHRTLAFADVVSMAFGPQEQAYVSTFGALAFYKIWTLREARAKALGEGLALAADGQDQILMPWKVDAWTEGQWRCFFTRPSSSHSLSIVASGQGVWGEARPLSIPFSTLFQSSGDCCG